MYDIGNAPDLLWAALEPRCREIVQSNPAHRMRWMAAWAQLFKEAADLLRAYHLDAFPQQTPPALFVYPEGQEHPGFKFEASTENVGLTAYRFERYGDQDIMLDAKPTVIGSDVLRVAPHSITVVSPDGKPAMEVFIGLLLGRCGLRTASYFDLFARPD